MTAPAIHRVARLDLAFRPVSWPFADERRAEIDAHFAAKRIDTPQLWNGRVLLGRDPVFAGDVFTAHYFETDFASFLAWRDWGFPGDDVFAGSGMAAIRSVDGAFILGEMARHTANAGRIYFASGTPDLVDIKGETVDIAGSIEREVAEETGLTRADYRASPFLYCVVAGAVVAIIQVLDVEMTGEALRTKIEANLARQASPELSAIHLIRDRRDFTPMMPDYVTAFIEHAGTNPV